MGSIRTLLGALYKDDLRNIGESLGLKKFGIAERKGAMVEALAGFILNHPEDWLRDLTEVDLRLLKKGIEAGKDKPVKMEILPIPSALEGLCTIELKFSEDLEGSFVVVSDVYDAIRDKVDEVIALKEADGSFQLDRMILSILNIYGMVPFRVFLDSLEDLRREAGFRPILLEDLAKSIILMMSRIDTGNQIYLATPYMNNPEMILGLRKKNRSSKGSRYAKIDARRALEVAELMPYGTYGAKSEEGQAVLDMLRALGYTEEECMEELHDIWLNAQLPMKETDTEMLFGAVEDVVDSIGKFDRYEECIRAIADYANTVPKWILRGFSANEAGTLKVDIQVEESAAQAEADIPDYLRKGLPQPDTTTDVSKYGIAIKRVGLGDPCPCGSGLTYGRCHGKHVN
ncbi:MAG: SEC-C domain-containing protein [Bacteroidia bacterium]|nr:SEC-C domain-containing protein [Bacteroidia bacterium]